MLSFRWHCVVRRSLAPRCFSTSAGRLDRYGFIGLGQMGSCMAKNLQAKSSPKDVLRLYDVNTAATKKMVQTLGVAQTGGAAVEEAKSVADVAKDVDVLITALPEPLHVKQVYSTIAASSPYTRSIPRLFIDCSTIDPSSSRAAAATITAAFPPGEAHFADAPMSGGTVGAEAGTLTFMLGCSAADAETHAELVSRIEIILLKMGKRVFHCGGQGAGLSAKLANNYLLAINNIATAEAMNLGMRWDLDPKVLAGVINASTGRCWPSEMNNPVPGVCPSSPAGRDYKGGFGVGLMRKDLGLAMVAAEEAGAQLWLADEARDVYEVVEEDEKCKGRDFSVVYRYLGGKE